MSVSFESVARAFGPAMLMTEYPDVTFVTYAHISRSAIHHWNHCSTVSTLAVEVVT